MAQMALTRQVYFLPGKRDEAVNLLKQHEAIRRRYGLVQQLILRKNVDPSVHLIIQIWESEEAYQRWLKSEDRARVWAEERKLRAREPTVTFTVL